jgi:predicted aspartyl protease
MLTLGEFDSSGSPIIAIKVAGPSGAKHYKAVIDTGFTGFVELPISEMIELGLKSYGAANVMLGDGSVITNLLSSSDVHLGNQIQNGTILLAEGSAGVLVGLAFLREFKKSLILTTTAVFLYDEDETLEAIIELMMDLPQGQPNTSSTVVSSESNSHE